MVDAVDAATLVGYVHSKTDPKAVVYTDEARAYGPLRRVHEIVRHSVGEYVREMAHTNGLESFWAMVKRGCNGVFHNLSAKRLNRYIQEFAGRHNLRLADTEDQMKAIVRGMDGRRLPYEYLIGPPHTPTRGSRRFPRPIPPT